MRPLRDVGRSQGVRTRHPDFHAERHLARRAAKARRLESPAPWRPRETRGALPAKGPRPASADHTGRAERAGGVEGGVRVAGERYGDTRALRLRTAQVGAGSCRSSRGRVRRGRPMDQTGIASAADDGDAFYRISWERRLSEFFAGRQPGRLRMGWAGRFQFGYLRK